MVGGQEARNQEQLDWLAVLGRTLAYLCIKGEEFKSADLGTRALFLEGIGVPRKDVAVLLRTTENTVRVKVNDLKRKERKKSGRAKN